jgi:tartrate dehydratase beta subunit/fumarate hydratase class I family protein
MVFTFQRGQISVKKLKVSGLPATVWVDKHGKSA